MPSTIRAWPRLRCQAGDAGSRKSAQADREGQTTRRARVMTPLYADTVSGHRRYFKAATDKRLKSNAGRLRRLQRRAGESARRRRSLQVWRLSVRDHRDDCASLNPAPVTCLVASADSAGASRVSQGPRPGHARQALYRTTFAAWPCGRSRGDLAAGPGAWVASS